MDEGVADGSWAMLAEAACMSLVRVLGPELTLDVRQRFEPTCSGSTNMGSGKPVPRIKSRGCPSEELCSVDGGKDVAKTGAAGRETGGEDWSTSARLAPKVCKPNINICYSFV